ncbi:MAG: DUF2167 domain-containing protein [Desulfocurvibacter africanus]
MSMKNVFCLLLCLLMLATVLLGTTQAQTQEAEQSLGEILESLQYRSGTIQLKDDLAQLTLDDKYVYLDSRDTETFLTQIWDNPPGSGSNTLGMIIPTEFDPLGESGWVAIIDFDPVGFVSDDDAEGIDYDELMESMRKGTEEANRIRAENGYEPVHLLGWAQEPYFDSEAKKLYWAKRLKFGDSEDEVLNYNIRVLGRRGVLNLNVVASMSELGQVNGRANELLKLVSFSKGNTYAEYDSKIDKAAGYGIAGLIAGGVLTKAGFFKALLAGILAFKKVIIVGLIAVGSAVFSIFRRKSRKADGETKSEPKNTDS